MINHNKVLYGNKPEDMGLVDLNPTEMMFWLYCPIKAPQTSYIIPPNLRSYYSLLNKIKEDVSNKYVYLTAKTLYVENTYSGNRPGWHSDGFGTDDVNYIWYDNNPTEFTDGKLKYNLPEDCKDAMNQMEINANNSNIVTYPNKHLLRLDQSVIHRAPNYVKAGIRTFVKISISNDKYNLIGNSINHKLPIKMNMVKRNTDRNHPTCKDFVS